MNPRPFYVIAEIRRDADGRVLPKRCVSGPYAEYLLARQVRDVLGEDFHVFTYEQVRQRESRAVLDRQRT